MSVGVARQSGVAMALVMWLLSAMTITVGGLVSLSRDDVSLAEGQLNATKAFYVGKGVTRLVMRDRLLTVQSGEAPLAQGSAAPRIYSGRYSFGGAQIEARVLPASGFVSLLSGDEATWTTLLTKVGGLDLSVAEQVAADLRGLAGVSSGARPSNLTGFGAYKYKYGGGAGNVGQIESLLAIDGMTRDAYERIRRSIAPFSGPTRPNLVFAPSEIRAAFSQIDDNAEGAGEALSNRFCVEVSMDFGGDNRYEQRIWVIATDVDRGALDLVKIERPVRAPDKSLG